MSLAAAGVAETAMSADPDLLSSKGKPPPKTRTLVAQPSSKLAPEAR